MAGLVELAKAMNPGGGMLKPLKPLKPLPGMAAAAKAPAGVKAAGSVPNAKAVGISTKPALQRPPKPPTSRPIL